MRLLLDEQRKRFAPGEPFGFDPRLRVRPTSPCWRKADEICSARVLLLMTRSGHVEGYDPGSLVSVVLRLEEDLREATISRPAAVGWRHSAIWSVGPYLDRRQRERGAYAAREAFPTRGDKAVRAQSIRGRMALNGLYVPAGAQWLPAFRTELLTFPAGAHDDEVDALGLIGQLLDRMVLGQK